MTGAGFTSGRKKGRERGYIDGWRPQAKTRALLENVDAVLEESSEQLPVTIRQVFYRLVAVYGYEKTENSYTRLCETLNRARRSKRIDFNAIRDDRVATVRHDWFKSEADYWDHAVRGARRYQRDRLQDQAVRIEVWCEAQGMLPQLAKVASPFSVPVYSTGGFASLTAVKEIAERVLEYDKPTVFLHVGDYDPSGQAVFDHLEEDVSAFVEADRDWSSQQFRASRVALTEEQVDVFDLETAPAKLSDSRTAAWKGETCQLEALSPALLAQLVREALAAHIDIDKLQGQLDLEHADKRQILLALPRAAS